MIDYREDPESDIIEITVDGGISREEFERIAARLEAHIARHGKVRLLEEIRSFGGIDPATFWADLKFSLRHLRDFSRCAVVTDKRWIEWLAKAMDPLVACEIRHFPPDQIAAARSWLGAAPAPASKAGS
jgi:SpoIIAA-like